MPPRPPPPAAADPKAERLAEALRANLRRRKATSRPSAAASDPPAVSRVDDGAEDREGLYPSGHRTSGDT